MGHTQGGWEEQRTRTGVSRSARECANVQHSDGLLHVARETGGRKGPHEAVEQGAHHRPGLDSGGGGRMERDNEPGTDPSGPNKEHLLPCPTHAHNTGCAMRKVSVVGTLCGKMH